MKLRTIRLHGALGQRFGFKYRFAVDSVGEAIRALVYQIPDFGKVLAQGEYRVVRDRMECDDVTLGLALGKTKLLRIIPVAAGSKSRAGKIILGIALLAGAFAFAPSGGGFLGKKFGASAFKLFGASVSFGTIGVLGAALTLGGIAAAHSPLPGVGDYGARDQPAQRPSFLFDRPVNTSAQGVAVPVTFGRFRVGSVVISAGIETEQIP